MWILIDTRVSVFRDSARDQGLIWRLSREIKAVLEADRRQQAEEAGGKIEALLALYPPLYKESWHQMKGWYNSTANRVPPPALVTLERITSEQVALYCRIPPPGENIPISVKPLLVDDSLPTEIKIEWEVHRLSSNHSGGPSGMRVENL